MLPLVDLATCSLFKMGILSEGRGTDFPRIFTPLVFFCVYINTIRDSEKRSKTIEKLV